MERFVVAASLFELFSHKEGLETQLVFGEVLDSSSPKPPMRPVYRALEQETVVKGEFIPYPGYHAFSRDFSEFSPFFLNLIPMEPTYRPNVVVKTLDARLLPWNIPLPYGTYLQCDFFGNVSLPFSKEIFDPSYRKILSKAYCSPKCVAPIPRKLDVHELLKDAYQMLGIPYLYGGRTAFSTTSRSMGIDCSGFVNLLFRAQGIFFPRNASDQHNYCTPVSSFNLLPVGGLIFLEEEGILNHVMIKSINNEIIHASLSVGCVNVIKEKKSFLVDGNRMLLLCKKQGKDIWKAYEAFYGVPKNNKKAEELV
ncbi:C40 family peptidase [Chlamydiifrater phoenicopteri]|uniref:C40 family peptidase n=1 Tax=Chlamydiifrater phoenicopteri TaxID=2681469 RepID=UPI001BD10D1C|nr:NlpC/P60 family protein [Chlamydiifrater phoenicopteri]